MGIILEIFLQIFAEFMVQFLLEIVLGTSVHRVKSHSKVKVEATARTAFAFLAYGLGGAFLGLLSTFVLPNLFLKDNFIAIINLILSPIVAGLLMSLIGYMRKKKCMDVIRLESFLGGWGFAFFFAVVRYLVIKGV